jgi:hypothetical protein
MKCTWQLMKDGKDKCFKTATFRGQLVGKNLVIQLYVVLYIIISRD